MPPIAQHVGKHLWEVTFNSGLKAWVITDTRSMKIVATKSQALTRRRSNANEFYMLKVNVIAYHGTVDA